MGVVPPVIIQVMDDHDLVLEPMVGGDPPFQDAPISGSNRNGASKSTARVLRNVDILWQIPWGIAHMLDTVDGCEILPQLIDDSSHYS